MLMAGSKDASMRFYTVSTLSEHRFLTPEGFLLVTDVPIARTGIQMYGADEVPIEADGSGAVRISREEGEVFRNETVASFAGKPVTNDHPADLVNPENWKEHAVGTIQNVRRGEGIENDLLYADLLITHHDAIDDIESGKVEVSCGYDAEYEQTAPGYGRQFNIIGNHVALVDKGRCGARCAIGDQQRRNPMTTKQTIVERVKERLQSAFKTRDAKALDEAIGDFEAITEGGGNESAGHITANVVGGGQPQEPTSGERLRTIEDWMKARDAEKEEEKKAKDKAAKDAAEEEEKKKKESEDSARDCKDEFEKKEGEEEKEHEKRTGDALRIIKTQAEILSPGFKLPTLDCKCKDKKVRDQVTDIKRKVLDAALKTTDGKKAIEPFLIGKTLDSLDHAAIDSAFLGATEVMRVLNNKSAPTNDNILTVDAFSKGGIDKINQDFWKNLNKKGA